MKRAAFFLLGCVLGSASWIAAAPPVARPNIVWLIIEDVGPDFGCFGNRDVRTPAIDAFARESRLYHNAFATAPVCSPSRSAFMTGRYQTSFGAHHHRSHRKDGFRRPAEVKLLTERLRAAGYYSANLRGLPPELGFHPSGKTDWNFFDDGKAFDTDKWRDLKGRDPFYVQINLRETHRPYRQAEANGTNPAKVTLPPYLADDPIIRADWAAYLDELAVVDDRVGKILQLLDREGLRDNTAVFLFGDNGREDFRGKCYATEQGLHVPLIVRWPALCAPGSTSRELVSLLDVHATTLALAGIPTDRLDGWPFAGPGAKPREYVFAARDRIDETLDRVRTVRDARYKYLRNFEPERPYLQLMPYTEATNPTYRRMRQLFAEGRLNQTQAKFMAARRPAEELYDLAADPFELQDVAADSRHAPTLRRLRAVLDEWIRDTRDQGAVPEDPQALAEEVNNPVRRQSTEKLRRALGLDPPAPTPPAR